MKLKFIIFVDHSDQERFIYLSDKGIKATLGITGLLGNGVLIFSLGCHLDVDLAHPSGVGSRKGWAVLPLNALHELGSQRRKAAGFLSCVRLVEYEYRILVREDWRI
jgi:hypothetical protein